MARGKSFVVAAGDMFGLIETRLRDLAFARENYTKIDHSQVYKEL